jgi:aspartate aminotransferase
MKLSRTVENMIGSEILKISGEAKERILRGESIYNLTVGDFNPEIFPIPEKLSERIIHYYKEHRTNYPAANGELNLRSSLAELFLKDTGITYDPEEIIIGAGGRPLLYSVFESILDPGDGVIYPVPSWNNEHYCILTDAKSFIIETKAEDHFMPSAEDMRPFLKEANIIALNSPLNPSGTIITKEALTEICEMVLEENHRRGKNEKPLFLVYDQIYSYLIHGDQEHYTPISIYPEMKEYTVIIDGISKWLAGTGVRVGWALGPKPLMAKIKTFLGHVGAWAAKPEQLAVADFLHDKEFGIYLKEFNKRICSRLDGFYEVFSNLKKEGYPVDVIAPQAAIYLTVKLDLIGARKEDGSKLNTVEEVFSYILNEAKIALVPFYAFGASKSLPWFRLSIGTTRSEDIAIINDQLKKALDKLSYS